MRPIPPQALDLIKRFEGLRLRSYLDPAGIWTIGYGHTFRVEPHMYISEPTANSMLFSDATVTAIAIHRVAPSLNLNDNQFAAVVSFVFNVGAGAFATSHLLKFLEIANYSAAANEFPRWCHNHTGIILAGLQLRRKAEQELFNKPTLTEAA